jgi:predicted RNA binding protein with dsRBD fold (UPF0201 family)
VRATINCPIFPTEDRTRVKEAILFLFPDAKQANSIDTADNYQGIKMNVNNASQLDSLRTLIHDARIIDAIRVILEHNETDCTTSLCLDKQAAVLHKLRIVDETDGIPPLGCIRIDLQFDNEQELNQALRWLVPPTRDGRIVRN